MNLYSSFIQKFLVLQGGAITQDVQLNKKKLKMKALIKSPTKDKKDKNIVASIIVQNYSLQPNIYTLYKAETSPLCWN